MDILGSEARCAPGHEEAADAVVGLGPDGRDVRDAAVGNPHLAAGQDPVIAIAHRPGAHAGRVRSEVWLGQPEAADRLARGQPRKPLLLLLLRAVLPDREHRQRTLHRYEAAQAAVPGL